MSLSSEKRSLRDLIFLLDRCRKPGSEELGGNAGLFIIGVKMDVIFDLPSRRRTIRHAFRVLIVTGFVELGRCNTAILSLGLRLFQIKELSHPFMSFNTLLENKTGIIWIGHNRQRVHFDQGNAS